MARRARAKRAQIWVGLKSADPEAVSALGVARAHLPAGRTLQGLRRFRVFEVTGALPERDELERLLHRSTQFYNPHKEWCAVREAAGDPTPLERGERAVLVVDREGERRPAAERWWRHETGETVTVREGIAWLVRFEGAADPETLTDLAIVRGRRHGLLCNFA